MMEQEKYRARAERVNGMVMGEHNYVNNNYYGVTGPAPTASVTSAWNIPFSHNPFFMGRDDLLLRLRQQLTTQGTTALTQTQAISGLGGIGKTQMAVEYAYRYRPVYPFVFWIRAESRELLITDMAAL